MSLKLFFSSPLSFGTSASCFFADKNQGHLTSRSLNRCIKSEIHIRNLMRYRREKAQQDSYKDTRDSQRGRGCATQSPENTLFTMLVRESRWRTRALGPGSSLCVNRKAGSLWGYIMVSKHPGAEVARGSKSIHTASTQGSLTTANSQMPEAQAPQKARYQGVYDNV